MAKPISVIKKTCVNIIAIIVMCSSSASAMVEKKNTSDFIESIKTKLNINNTDLQKKKQETFCWTHNKKNMGTTVSTTYTGADNVKYITTETNLAVKGFWETFIFEERTKLLMDRNGKTYYEANSIEDGKQRSLFVCRDKTATTIATQSDNSCHVVFPNNCYKLAGFDSPQNMLKLLQQTNQADILNLDVDTISVTPASIKNLGIEKLSIDGHLLSFYKLEKYSNETTDTFWLSTINTETVHKHTIKTQDATYEIVLNKTQNFDI